MMNYGDAFVCYEMTICQIKKKSVFELTDNNLNCQMDAPSTQFDTTMLEFQQLPAPPELNEQLLNQLDASIKGLHWSATFQCITMIRSICRYYPQHILNIFCKYGMQLLELFSNGATQNIKNIFKLLREVFLQGQNVNVEAVVAAFLPLVVKKAANDSGQIKEICQELMSIMANHCCYPRVIELSVELSCDKSPTVSEIAIKLLALIMMGIGNSLMQLNSALLQMIMKGMSFLINGKRNNMKTSALDVCIFICNQIGAENYIQLMEFSITPQEVAAMSQAMESHRTQKQKGPQLADVLKQRKMQSLCWNQAIR